MKAPGEPTASNNERFVMNLELKRRFRWLVIGSEVNVKEKENEAIVNEKKIIVTNRGMSQFVITVLSAMILEVILEMITIVSIVLIVMTFVLIVMTHVANTIVITILLVDPLHRHPHAARVLLLLPHHLHRPLVESFDNQMLTIHHRKFSIRKVSKLVKIIFLGKGGEIKCEG